MPDMTAMENTTAKDDEETSKTTRRLALRKQNQEPEQSTSKRIKNSK
jgi:hypothetical protein